MCAVGSDGMVGIDLEKITKPKPELHSLLFREEEECMGAKDFFNRWTIKESYLKAIGTGLLVDLQEIELEEKIGVNSMSTINKNGIQGEK